MRVNDAKDFLVQQTVEQARLDGVPFSDLERRMMYFTEGKGAVEDAVSLNEEFEAQYKTEKYEAKVSKLMGRALRRLKKGDKEGARKWAAALRTLRKEDHYIFILAGHPLKHISVREVLAFGFLLLVIFSPWIFLRLTTPGLRKPPVIELPFVPNPHILQALFLALIAIGVFFPRILMRPFDWILAVFDKIWGLQD